MKGATRNKPVTSGRLTGRVKTQSPRKQVISHPAPAVCLEPAFSLYSNDSEDQVTDLHAGLDRCAALLSGILQGEKEEAVRSPTAAPKKEGAKSKPSSSLGKRISKKAPPQTEQRSWRRKQEAGAGSTTPRRRLQSAHSGVKLHPPHTHTQTQRPSLLPRQTPKQPSSYSPHPQVVTPPPSPASGPSSHSGQTAADAQHTHSQNECVSDEEEIVPVRDDSAQSTSAHTHTAVRHTHTAVTHTHTPTHTHIQLDVSEDGGAEKVQTVQYLMRQLKALITGQGSVAERLLSDLEQTVSFPSMNIQTEAELSSLRSQNTELRRRVKILNQQLKEKERRQNETLFSSEVFPLQEELAAAQTRLQELQDDLTELRKAFGDKQKQLSDREATAALMASELDATRIRLLDSERERSELVSEMERLKRALQTRMVAVGSASDSFPPQQHRAPPSEPPTDRVTHYLTSLGALEPPHTERLRVAAGKEGNQLDSLQLKDPSEQRRRRADESVCSDWSVKSWSTFDTRDEAAFRDGLSALDASIASLQKTLQMDLGR
ncbi:coiled-coil domain-containing protein 14 isoform X2 [Antennarius striatus]|uniref:coiled-coil domain-containing protein 14 isoform X2 n=1 Tax=Antennarius striatus TaxID=241820 RepID=UPI0035B25CE3